MPETDPKDMLQRLLDASTTQEIFDAADDLVSWMNNGDFIPQISPEAAATLISTIRELAGDLIESWADYDQTPWT